MKPLSKIQRQTYVIRVRYYGQNTYLATTPQQGVYRGRSCEQGFDRAAEMLVDAHFPGCVAVPVSPDDARIAALGIQLGRTDADPKESRWYVVTA
jgi:hypothetical protein